MAADVAAADDINEQSQASGSPVLLVPTSELEPEVDPSACLVCGRDSCEDTTACLRQHSALYADVEDVFGPLVNVSVESSM